MLNGIKEMLVGETVSMKAHLQQQQQKTGIVKELEGTRISGA